jgi:hypothetical protein
MTETSDREETAVITPEELEILAILKDKSRIKLVITKDHLDTKPYLIEFINVSDKEEERYARLDTENLLKKAEALRFLNSFIAARRGIKVEDVTDEYIEKMLQESSSQADEEHRNLPPPKRPPHTTVR